MIPGNHDPCGPGSVYERDEFRRRPANLHFHDRVRPVPLPEFGATLFPCPCSARFGDDPMGWIACASRRRRAPDQPGAWVAAGRHRRGGPNYPIFADAPRTVRPRLRRPRRLAHADARPHHVLPGRMYYAGAPEVGGWDETGAGYALEVVLEPGTAPRIALCASDITRGPSGRPGRFARGRGPSARRSRRDGVSRSDRPGPPDRRLAGLGSPRR